MLIKAGAQEMLFAQVIRLLRSKDLILKKGTIVDSTIISAPSLTKNNEHKRDPKANSVKKGNEWKFGYKAHIGVDSKSGLVHSLEVTAANVHDVTMTSELLTSNVIMPLYATNMVKKLNTKSIANQVRSNVSPKAVSTRLKKRTSKIFSLFVKLDTGANESSLLN